MHTQVLIKDHGDRLFSHGGIDLKLASGVEAIAAYKLRHEVYVEENGWRDPTDDGLEKDEFDDDTNLLVAIEQSTGETLGTMRVANHTQPWMVETAFAPTMPSMESVETIKLSNANEVSRLAVRKDARTTLHDGYRIVEMLLGAVYLMNMNSTPRVDKTYVTTYPVASALLRRVGLIQNQIGPTADFGDCHLATYCVPVPELTAPFCAFASTSSN